MTCDDPIVAAVVEDHRRILVEALIADAEVARVSRCLALGGGYGRGEGGVQIHRDGRRTPHNDYDLVLVHQAAAIAVVSEWCQRISQRFTAEFGLHVDVTPLAGETLTRLPQSLTWYEFGQGHQVWWGDGAVLSPLAVRRLADVDPWEWGRLLMNRSAGVVFARWSRQGCPVSLGADEDPATFATRQIEKAWLALGDVWLADHGLYHDRLAVRRTTWQSLTAVPTWAPRWEAAAAYKLRPRDLSLAEIDAELAALSPVLAEALQIHTCADTQPLRDLARTLLRVPPARWFARRPWAPLRERVQAALVAELVGRQDERRRLIGEPHHVLSLWKTVA